MEDAPRDDPGSVGGETLAVSRNTRLPHPGTVHLTGSPAPPTSCGKSRLHAQTTKTTRLIYAELRACVNALRQLQKPFSETPRQHEDESDQDERPEGAEGTLVTRQQPPKAAEPSEGAPPSDAPRDPERPSQPGPAWAFSRAPLAFLGEGAREDSPCRPEVNVRPAPGLAGPKSSPTRAHKAM